MFFEINKMRKKLSPIFGFQFPKAEFDKRLIPLAKTMTKVGRNFLNEKKLKMFIEKLYKLDLPKFSIYINTTPFSSWNVKGKYLSISYTRSDEIKFFSTVCHEANHLMYDLIFGTDKYQDTEVKETLTVLNNFFGIEDKGWQKFSKQRKKVLDFYSKTNNFEMTVAYTKKLYR